MASPEPHTSRSTVICHAEDVEVAFDPALDRRAHERLKASELEWLRGARLKYGPEVRVLDLSAGGILLETDSELTRDAAVVVELAGPASPILVPSRVLRCRTASFGEIIRYQGACVFKRPLAIPELVAASQRLTEAIVARRVHEATQESAAWQKVVARYQDGRVLCGYTNDFHPSKARLHLSSNPRHGDSTVVPLSELKALFFVREFTGDPTFVERKVFDSVPQGRKIEVVFHDDEVLIGSTLGYRGDGSGFFVHPADHRSNNLRVFVPPAGIRRVRFL